MVHRTPGRNLLAMWIAAILVSAPPAAEAQDDSPLETALHYFTRHDARDFVERIDAARPVPVRDDQRLRILATLPLEGDLRDLNTAQRKKLAALRPVLELHRREAVYVIKVIEVPQAAVGLHARAVVLVSERALDLLDAQELQALVAHEVGRELFWDQYSRARRDEGRSSLRTLELLCDGFAVVTLRHLGVSPERLISALEKMVRYDRDRFGTAVNENNYPPIGDGRRFVGRLVEWLGQSGSE